jgi:hypothetical protein
MFLTSEKREKRDRVSDQLMSDDDRGRTRTAAAVENR